MSYNLIYCVANYLCRTLQVKKCKMQPVFDGASKRRFSRRFEDCCIDHPSKHTQQAVGPTRTDPYPFLQRSPQPRPTLSAYPAVNCRRQCHRTAARSPETIRKKAPSARLRCKQSRLKLIIPLRSPTRSPVGVRTATRGIASVQP